MPGSVTSVFSEPEDFQAALREDGVLGMLITRHGRFRTRLTQIALHRLRLSAAEEQLPRIAFVAVPADAVMVPLPMRGGPSPIWGGIGTRADEIITLGPDQRVYARTDDVSDGQIQFACRLGLDVSGKTVGVARAIVARELAPPTTCQTLADCASP